MDVVLEVFDTFLGDRLYASLLPAHQPIQTSSIDINGTLSSFGKAVTGYTYLPASQYISFEPSQFAYMSQWPRDHIARQGLSLFFITWLFGVVIYFVFATLSYVFIFDKETFRHPKYLKGQIALEIKQSLTAFPIMAIFTAPCFLLEVRGHSKIYDVTADGPGRWYDYAQFPFFIAFTDMFIYAIHRGLHHKAIYKHLHKAHHKWVVPTPFASHAFHPLDGFAQSVPYHVFPFIFPLQKFAYIILFTFINIWTVMIHDGEYAMNSQVINGAACHTMHHLYFNFNYGQFTTLWDRLCGSYRQPNEELFRRETKMGTQEWSRQVKEAEQKIKDVEGVDDRTYAPDSKKVN